jgi:hypothetical protein
MAGSSTNWFKKGAGKKGSVFISNAVIVSLTGQASITPAEMREAKAWLRDNADDAALNRLADRSIQPEGQAKERIPEPPPARPPTKGADEVTERIKPNVTVNFANARTARDLGTTLGLGRAATADDIAGLMGALDGATMEVGWDDMNETFEVYVVHPFYQSYRQFTDDGTSIANVTFTVSPNAPPGVATRVVARQMDAAAKMGIQTVFLTAAGEKGDDYNGYYTWPRLGFDAKIPWNTIKRAPPGLRSATTLLDLFSRPGGPEWWKEHGSEIVVSFDPSLGSPNRQALDDYLAVKGIDPYAPFP